MFPRSGLLELELPRNLMMCRYLMIALGLMECLHPTLFQTVLPGTNHCLWIDCRLCWVCPRLQMMKHLLSGF